MGKLELTDSMENYLEAISILEEKKKYVRVKDIARYMKVKMPSVTGALKSLSERELVNHEKYEYVELTHKGTEIAQEIRRRHDAIMKFLTEVLKIDQKSAEKDVCGMEHAISPDTMDRLLKMIQCLEECPNSINGCMKRFDLYLQEE